ncbi:MAG: periplasmic heavy metal sensor [Rhodobacteraceae bacterium]|nr:periplasmic heavy metal sensor [Paracoccaceae bacterium]
MTEIHEQPRSKTPKWVRILLALSLALNLLVIGLVGGAMMRFGGPDGMRPPPRSIGAVLYRALPDEQRRALRSYSRQARSGHVKQRRGQIKAISATIRATPFDADAVSVVLDSHRSELDLARQSLQLAWLAQVEQMSDEERQAYGERLENPPKQGWPRRRPEQP